MNGDFWDSSETRGFEPGLFIQQTTSLLRSEELLTAILQRPAILSRAFSIPFHPHYGTHSAHHHLRPEDP